MVGAVYGMEAGAEVAVAIRTPRSFTSTPVAVAPRTRLPAATARQVQVKTAVAPPARTTGCDGAESTAAAAVLDGVSPTGPGITSTAVASPVFVTAIVTTSSSWSGTTAGTASVAESAAGRSTRRLAAARASTTAPVRGSDPAAEIDSEAVPGTVARRRAVSVRRSPGGMSWATAGSSSAMAPGSLGASSSRTPSTSQSPPFSTVSARISSWPTLATAGRLTEALSNGLAPGNTSYAPVTEPLPYGPSTARAYRPTASPAGTRARSRPVSSQTTSRSSYVPSQAR